MSKTFFRNEYKNSLPISIIDQIYDDYLYYDHDAQEDREEKVHEMLEEGFVGQFHTEKEFFAYVEEKEILSYLPIDGHYVCYEAKEAKHKKNGKYFFLANI